MTGHTISVSALLFDVSNSGSGGRTARVAGKKDTSGEVQADFDLDAPPFNSPPTIEPGQSGLLLSYISPTAPIQWPGVIEKVDYVCSGQNTQVKYSFSVKENCRAGSFVYPAL